ncbi:MAG: CoA-binding protein [Deltaproteobacteria bacterium]|nr:CoA-binding protein [Deltaproteobacteria bacterium]
MAKHELEDIFNPRSIAVVGASEKRGMSGRQFFEGLIEYGYQGDVYPVNPNHSEILGRKAYADITDIPGTVDYVISSIPAPYVLDLVECCSQKGVKAIHFFTARFSETGRPEAAQLERELLKTTRQKGIRIIGPNCMGMYHPSKGISFSDALPKESGSAGLISQSGQIAEELSRYAALRGVYFNKAVSYGNALDFNECDFLDYFAQDPDISIILMYIEGIKDGDKFFKKLQRAARVKPVVIMKGGRGKSGSRAVASHTASMAGSLEIIEGLIRQAGAVSTSSLEELIDIAACFYHLPPITGFRVGVGGGGGGASVLSADQCEEAGLDVIPLPDEIKNKLREKGSSIWDWIGNPVDMSIRDRADFMPGHVLELMAVDPHFDLLIAIIDKPILAVLPDKAMGADNYDHWSWKTLCEMRTLLLKQGIPFFPTIKRAAVAAYKAAEYCALKDRK